MVKGWCFDDFNLVEAQRSSWEKINKINKQLWAFESFFSQAQFSFYRLAFTFIAAYFQLNSVENPSNEFNSDSRKSCHNRSLCFIFDLWFVMRKLIKQFVDGALILHFLRFLVIPTQQWLLWDYPGFSFHLTTKVYRWLKKDLRTWFSVEITELTQNFQFEFNWFKFT